MRSFFADPPGLPDTPSFHSGYRDRLLAQSAIPASHSTKTPQIAALLLTHLGSNYFHITLIINLIQRLEFYRSRKGVFSAYICYYKVNYSFDWQKPFLLLQDEGIRHDI
jgi:hypothetical protein